MTKIIVIRQTSGNSVGVISRVIRNERISVLGKSCGVQSRDGVRFAVVLSNSTINELHERNELMSEEVFDLTYGIGAIR